MLAFKREGYRKTDVNCADLFETPTFPGFLEAGAEALPRRDNGNGALREQTNIRKGHRLAGLVAFLLPINKFLG